MSRPETLKRRLGSISIIGAALVGATVTLPILLLASLLHDVVALVMGRRRFMAVCLTLMGWLYLGTEALGVIALGGLWLASAGGRSRRFLIGGTYVIQRWWAGSVFLAIRTIFGIHVEVEGSALLTPGPIMVFMRHTSIIDNLLPSVLITAPQGIKLRYVLKRELLSDPALDIAGSRLPNYFVDRRSVDPDSEAQAIGRLGIGLGCDEGVLIYPEGTRFTPERRTRALKRLQASNPELYARATAMRSVLPPPPWRTAGTIGCPAGCRRGNRGSRRPRRIQSPPPDPPRRPGRNHHSRTIPTICSQ